MKSKHIISLYMLLAGLCLTATSCEDMLTPDMERYSSGFSGKDTVNAYLGICRDLQEVVEQHVLLGELRSDLVATTEYSSDSITGIVNLDRSEMINGENTLLNRAAYYKVINECNHYLAVVDTMATKNHIPYMRKETAQVMLIRAWTYMQLVQVYGEVPFITEPVKEANSDVVANATTVTADNLLDKLEQSDLARALTYEQTYGYPDYGTFNTGNVNVPHRTMIFPGKLVFADLHLLRGDKNRNDFEIAANYYYEFLKDYQRAGNYGVSRSRAATYNKWTFNGQERYSSQPVPWIGSIVPTGDIPKNNEFITIVPGAANNAFGHMLTKIPNIYGFDIHSYNNMGEEESDGEVTLYANYKVRQVQPSKKFESICNSQQYYIYDEKEGGSVYPENVGDARLDGAAPIVRSEEGDGRFIQKFGASDQINNGTSQAWNFKYRYCVPVYRYSQVMLRYAEAVNRAGFPRYAYAILMAGTSSERIPVVADSIAWNADSTSAKVVSYVDSLDATNALYFLGTDELRRAEEKPWLQYTTGWSNVGIHTLGCGVYHEKDTLRVYDSIVAKRVEEELARVVALGDNSGIVDVEEEEKADTLKVQNSKGEVISVPVPRPKGALDSEINAVSTLIADEMALETAFEGYRCYDLMRIARHMNGMKPGYGTAWLAWHMARRNVDKKLYEALDEYDQELYGKMSDMQNWYLPNP